MSKFGWDLPPGVSVSDLPGNSAQDQADEALAGILYEALEPMGSLTQDVDETERCKDDIVLRLMRIVSQAYQEGHQAGIADKAQARDHLTEHMRSCLLDFVTMAKDEIQGVKTGKTPSGVRMRDNQVLGQWVATVREAEALL